MLQVHLDGEYMLRFHENHLVIYKSNIEHEKEALETKVSGKFHVVFLTVDSLLGMSWLEITFVNQLETFLWPKRIELLLQEIVYILVIFI